MECYHSWLKNELSQDSRSYEWCLQKHLGKYVEHAQKYIKWSVNENQMREGEAPMRMSDKVK